MNKKEQFYKTLNNIVGAERLTNEETYIINDYVSDLEAKIREAIEWVEYYKEAKLTKKEFNSYSYWLLEILKGEK